MAQRLLPSDSTTEAPNTSSRPQDNLNAYRTAGNELPTNPYSTLDHFLPKMDIVQANQAKPDGESKFVPGKTTHQTITVDGKERDYDVHTPKDWDGKTPLPVLYYFNGFSPAGREKESFTGLSERADREHFAVVYMDGAGKGHTYNNGQAVFDDGMDENKYLNAVHDKLKSKLPMNANYQGLAGFSEGGSEALDLAAKNNWVSSVQTVEGYSTKQQQALNRPISAQFINATQDDIVPIGGTASVEAKAKASSWYSPKHIFNAAVAAIEDHNNVIEPQSYSINKFTAADAANTTQKTETNNHDEIDTYKNSSTGVEVKAVKLSTGTHGWAGSTDHSGDIHFMNLGVPNETFNASDSIAAFLLNHPLGH
jgi:poly(3-hydroxybutyrate) depolymerase